MTLREQMNRPVIKWGAISAVCACVMTLIGSGGVYVGWRIRIHDEAVREERIDRHLNEAEPLIDDYRTVRQQVALHDVKIVGLEAAVNRLINLQDQTNEALRDLTRELVKRNGAR